MEENIKILDKEGFENRIKEFKEIIEKLTQEQEEEFTNGKGEEEDIEIVCDVGEKE